MTGVECIRSYREWILERPHDVERRINREMLMLGVSANASEGERREAFKYGMHYFCPKPAEMSMLRAILSIHRNGSGSLHDSLRTIGQVVEGYEDVEAGFDCQGPSQSKESETRETRCASKAPIPRINSRGGMSQPATLHSKIISGSRKGWMIFGKSTVAPIDSAPVSPSSSVDGMGGNMLRRFSRILSKS
jgi:hypothetical protein